jgi:hypothetical protein
MSRELIAAFALAGRIVALAALGAALRTSSHLGKSYQALTSPTNAAAETSGTPNVYFP